MRDQHKKRKSAGYPPSVQLLGDMVGASDPFDDDAILLRSLLCDEYCVHGLLDKWEKLARSEIEISPNEPMTWISLAGFFLHAKEDFDEALNTIEVAIGKARETGEWVRHAYCTRARIARKLENYDLLEETVRFLIDYRPAPGCIDIHLDHDFLVTLPPGKIDEEILSQYNALKSPKVGPFVSPGASE